MVVQIVEIEGIAVKVGEGRTRARFRIASVAALGAWLRSLAGAEYAAGRVQGCA